MAGVPSNQTNLWARSVRVLKGLAPHSRRHMKALALGAFGACCMVVARLALPWPLRAVAETWMDPAARTGNVTTSGIDPVLGMGVMFLALILLLGFSDYFARLYFARFSIGTVRDLRGSVFRSVVNTPAKRRKKRPGDLVSRLVGDTARIKAGMQGFLLHVCTNGLTLIGVTAIVLWMNVQLGLIFALAVVATVVVSVVTAGKVFRKALKVRKKEGQLADQIQSTVEKKKKQRAEVKQLNRSSGRHEASLTHLQGIATWISYGTFGVAMLAAIMIGSGAVTSGALPAADMVVVMMYALTMRGPIVRLARQGARTGKVLGPAYRLLQLQAKSNDVQEKLDLAARPASSDGKVRMLFTGHAPVHFACFQPLYERLAAYPDVDLVLSGGLRHQVRAKRPDGSKGPKKWEYDAAALYGPFGVPADRMISVKEMRTQDFDVVFGANTKLLQPRSQTLNIQIFHGISFRNKAVRLANMGCDYYFLIGPYMHRRFIDANLLEDDDDRAIQIGFLKTDRLLNGELVRADVLAEFGLTGERPVLVYAPTGAKDNSLEIMGEEVISRLTSTGRYDLLIKPHDHPTNSDVDWIERLSRYEDDHCKVVREPDVTRVLFLADVLISDASSVSNEYSLMDRPMVFLDTPELIAAAAEADESALDLDTWGRRGGMIVEVPEDVESAIEQSLADPQQYADIRRAMAKDFFYNPGGATDAAMSWLREHVLDPAKAAR